MEQYDLILVGAGLANVLIALRLQEKQPNLKIVIIEQRERVLGEHTWSFHRSDLSSSQLAWVLPLVDYRWPGYDVRFPLFARRLAGEYFQLPQHN